MIQLTIGNTWSSIDQFTPREMNNIGAALQRNLTVDVPGAKYLWAFKSGEWDGKVRLFKVNDLGGFQFLSGLAPLVHGVLDGDFDLNIVDGRSLVQPQLQQYTVPLRPYQHEVLSAAFSNMLGDVWWPRGILQVATGGGKTEIAVAMYQSYPVQTMFLVHRKDLLLQAQERFKKYGIQAGIIGASRFEPHHTLTIATVQTLLYIMKGDDDRKTLTSQLINDAQQVFFDEAHIMASSADKGNQFMEVGSWFDNAHAKWGLTATPFMRSQYDNCLLEGVSGALLAQVKADWLIKNGYLTPPKIKFIKVPGKLPMKPAVGRSNKAKAEYWRKVQSKGITCNSWRNKTIAAEIVNGPYPCLVLVKTIEQANEIARSFTFGFDVPILTGKSNAEQRRRIVRQLQSGTLKAVIATTIFDEGVDIPEIRKMIMASGGKSQVKLLQRVGRGVRLADNKHEVEIIDFGDQHNPMLRRHALERMRVWKAEGFEVTEA